jgi:acyl carrier protein
MSDGLKEELRDLILQVVNDPDLSKDDIKEDTELVGKNGLFFDSIDLLELIVELEKRYGIKIKDNDIILKHFVTFENFYNFVVENEKK